MNIPLRVEKEVKEEVEIRAKVYELLARSCLQEPDAKYVQAMTGLVELLREEGLIFEDTVLPPKVNHGELCQEFYDRFFVTVSGRYVPPFESAIRGRETLGQKVCYGAVNGLETLHVLSCYQGVGFNPWELETFKPLKEIPLADYLGFELAFMAYLSYAELAAYRANGPARVLQWRSLQQRFLEEHLSTWVLDYALLTQGATGDFFGVVAKLMAAWVTAEIGRASCRERV